ncbi:nucleotidyltransferase family protein [Methylocystis sp. B8]|uniref:nucleotidyltransferase family protein n=1 Tax=Methylocystis sp. B8 TaxID=544938 RepID=UPI001FEDF58A|nr:nucleotidyltransferase family protein [Methylocystis sp. B8]
MALAARASRRFGTENKLLADLGGKPLIRRVAEEILRSCAETVVFTGCDRALIEKALEGLPLRFVHNANWIEGMGSSIAIGVKTLGSKTQGAFIAPRDMPFLTSDLLRKLIAPFEASQGTSIIYPTTPMGEQRNPALWPRRFFPQLASLSGPQGAKQLLVDCKSSQKHAIILDENALIDIDLAADLEAARSRWKIA